MSTQATAEHREIASQLAFNAIEAVKAVRTAVDGLAVIAALPDCTASEMALHTLREIRAGLMDDGRPLYVVPSLDPLDDALGQGRR